MFNSVFKNRIFIVFLIMLVCLVPFSIAKPAQTDVRTVVIGAGIDRLKDQDNQIELSVQILVPHYNIGFNENAQVISATGDNVSKAFEKLSAHIGKIIGLSHCSSIVFGESMKDDDIASTLDWFHRSKRLDGNSVVVYSEGSAKKVLETSLKVDNNLSLSLVNILQFNRPLSFAIIANLYPFLKTYYSGHGAELVPIINLTKQDNMGLSVSESGSGGSGGSEESQGGQSGGSQGENQDYLSNNGDTAIFKNGYFVTKVENKNLLGFNDLLGNTQKGIVVLNNITDNNLTDAQVSVGKRSLNKFYKVWFDKNGNPCIEYNLKYKARIEQILQQENNLTLLKSYNDYFSNEVKDSFVSYIKDKCATAVNICKESNADCLKIYEKFNALKRTGWQKYINSLPNKDDYIKNVNFYINVSVDGMN